MLQAWGDPTVDSTKHKHDHIYTHNVLLLQVYYLHKYIHVLFAKDLTLTPHIWNGIHLSTFF